MASEVLRPLAKVFPGDTAASCGTSVTEAPGSEGRTASHFMIMANHRIHAFRSGKVAAVPGGAGQRLAAARAVRMMAALAGWPVSEEKGP